mgnify:CR=1 FL=1
MAALREGRTVDTRSVNLPPQYEVARFNDVPPIEWWTGPVDVVHGTIIAVPPSDAPLVLTIHDLAFLAHPDDAEFLCAGTLIRLAGAGWNVHIATATPGDAGSMTLLVAIFFSNLPESLVGAGPPAILTQAHRRRPTRRRTGCPRAAPGGRR